MLALYCQLCSIRLLCKWTFWAAVISDASLYRLPLSVRDEQTFWKLENENYCEVKSGICMLYELLLPMPWWAASKLRNNYFVIPWSCYRRHALFAILEIIGITMYDYSCAVTLIFAPVAQRQLFVRILPMLLQLNRAALVSSCRRLIVCLRQAAITVSLNDYCAFYLE